MQIFRANWGIMELNFEHNRGSFEALLKSMIGTSLTKSNFDAI